MKTYSKIGKSPTGTMQILFQRNRLSKYKGLCGPMGSGKTTTLIDDIQRNTEDRPPDKDGVRRARWLCVRSTSKESVSSAMASWIDQYKSTPEVIKRCVTDGSSAGTIEMEYNCPILKKYRRGEDYGLVNLEMKFIGVKLHVLEEKLKGTNLTGVWLNEVDLLDKKVFSFVSGRVKRFPSLSDKPDCVSKDDWLRGCHVIGDSNPPDEDNWYVELIKNTGTQIFRHTEAELIRQIEAGEIGRNVLYRQPSGKSPDAENLEFLHKDYYDDMICDNYDDENVIKKNVHGEFGKATSRNRGIIFRTAFSRVRHLSKDVAYNPSYPLIAGMDVGLHNACVIAQFIDDQVIILSEILCEDESKMPTGSFVNEILKPRLMQDYRISLGGTVRFCVDPTSANTSSTSGISTLSVLKEKGMNVMIAPTNDIGHRLSTVRSRLLRQLKGDEPAIIINQDKCTTLVNGFLKTYRYVESNLAGNDKPSKTFSSHVHDALQYLLTYIDKPNQKDPTLRGPIHRNNVFEQMRRTRRPVSYGTTFCP